MGTHDWTAFACVDILLYNSRISIDQEYAMSASTMSISTRTGNGHNAPQGKKITLYTILAALFAVELRESLDAATSGDKSDAAYTWGM